MVANNIAKHLIKSLRVSPSKTRPFLPSLQEKMKSGGGGSGAGGGVPLTLLEKNEVLSSRNNRKSNLGLLPQATLDLSSGADRAAAAAAVVLSKSGLELSTLV